MYFRDIIFSQVELYKSNTNNNLILNRKKINLKKTYKVLYNILIEFITNQNILLNIFQAIPFCDLFLSTSIFDFDILYKPLFQSCQKLNINSSSYAIMCFMHPYMKRDPMCVYLYVS